MEIGHFRLLSFLLKVHTDSKSTRPSLIALLYANPKLKPRHWNIYFRGKTIQVHVLCSNLALFLTSTNCQPSERRFHILHTLYHFFALGNSKYYGVTASYRYLIIVLLRQWSHSAHVRVLPSVKYVCLYRFDSVSS